MIGSHNLRYPRLLVEFEAEIKMTGSALAKNRKKFTLYCYFENKVHFYPNILVNTKTTISLWVGAWCTFASRYISTTIHLPFGR